MAQSLLGPGGACLIWVGEANTSPVGDLGQCWWKSRASVSLVGGNGGGSIGKHSQTT